MNLALNKLVEGDCMKTGEGAGHFKPGGTTSKIEGVGHFC